MLTLFSLVSPPLEDWQGSLNTHMSLQHKSFIISQTHFASANPPLEDCIPFVSLIVKYSDVRSCFRENLPDKSSSTRSRLARSEPVPHRHPSSALQKKRKM